MKKKIVSAVLCGLLLVSSMAVYAEEIENEAIVINEAVEEVTQVEGINSATDEDVLVVVDEEEQPENEVIEEAYSSYSEDELVGDMSGDGWKYNSATKTITFDCEEVTDDWKGVVGTDTNSNNNVENVVLTNKVKKIGNKAFYQCLALKNIKVTDNIVEIGSSAFYNCPHLSSIYIPDSVENIGGYAFAWCDELTSINIPSKMTVIKDGTFCSCESLTSITIPSNVEEIDDSAFSYCTGLTSVYIPETVTEIGNYSNPFDSCSNLNKITVAAANPIYTDMGANIIVEKSSKKLISGCNTSTIPSGITELSRTAFEGMDKLTSITIPSTVAEEIECSVFEDCGSLSSIKVEAGNPLYEDRGINAIVEKSSNKIVRASNTTVINSSITAIGQNAFSGCNKLSSITIPDSVKSIESAAFKNCESLVTVKLPNTINKLEGNTFQGCKKLENINSPSSIVEIKFQVFYGCESLKALPIGKGVKVIGDSVFYGCKGLTEAVIPNGVTSIGNQMFMSCDNLEYISIPSSVTVIGTNLYSSWNGRKLNRVENLSSFPIKLTSLVSSKKWYNINDKSKTTPITTIKNGTAVTEDYFNTPNPNPAPTPNPTPTPNPNSTAVTEKFSDIAPSKWYVNAVQYVVDNGIMSGTTDTTFEPDKPCTRAMMVTILYSSMGKPAVSGTTPFTDLKANWYKTPVLWAYQNNVTKGQTDTTFAPDKNVARQEMAVFLHSFAKHRGNDTSATTDLNKFVDISQLSSWAAPQMQWANANGIINGKGGGKLDPKGNATRAEVAAMIMSFQNKFGK